MNSNINQYITLSNSVEMPIVGFGTYKIQDGPDIEKAVQSALDTGYRSIDTASFYDNERGIGKAIHTSGIPREKIFITTKVWNSEQGYKNTLAAFDSSRKKLRTDYIDLYLIHWPVKGKFVETWKSMEELYYKKLIRAIGVSNFTIHHLKELINQSSIIPMVNQFELHPRLFQSDLITFCIKNKIQVESWAPLMRGKLFNHPLIIELSQKYMKTVAQILIRWNIQHNFVSIPKSTHPKRIIENFKVFDFSIEDNDIARIDALNCNERTGPDPDNFNF